MYQIICEYASGKADFLNLSVGNLQYPHVICLDKCHLSFIYFFFHYGYNNWIVPIYFSFFSTPISSSDWPDVSFNTNRTKKKPTMQPTPWMVKQMCKSMSSTKIGYVFTERKAERLNAQQIIATPIVRIWNQKRNHWFDSKILQG